MAQGIYSSRMSVWERNNRGLQMDHAGFNTIGEEKATTSKGKMVIGEVVNAPEVPVLEEDVETEETIEEDSTEEE